MKYNCGLCKKTFSQKSNLISHERRKFPCIKVCQDTNTTINNITPISANITPISTNITPISANITPETSPIQNIVESNNNILVCEFCNKHFGRKDVLKRHIFSRCKNKKNIIKDTYNIEDISTDIKEILKQNKLILEENKLLKQQYDELKNSINQNTNTKTKNITPLEI